MSLGLLYMLYLELGKHTSESGSPGTCPSLQDRPCRVDPLAFFPSLSQRKQHGVVSGGFMGEGGKGRAEAASGSLADRAYQIPHFHT